MTRTVKGPEVALFLLATIVAVPYCWWANAFVMVHVWDWYHAAWMPELSFKAALGASFIVALLTPAKMDKSKDEDRREGSKAEWAFLIGTCLTPWFVLAAARICRFVFFE